MIEMRGAITMESHFETCNRFSAFDSIIRKHSAFVLEWFPWILELNQFSEN